MNHLNCIVVGPQLKIFCFLTNFILMVSSLFELSRSLDRFKIESIQCNKNNISFLESEPLLRYTELNLNKYYNRYIN